ncbi:unnamed protein product [Peniophora sp. CBMAI 1063]|nr:unnamed protein product [Peniophora sp. CBMAI 1063]
MFNLLANSVTALSFGLQPALERALRFMQPAWNHTVQFEAFVASSTFRVGQLPGVPSNSIAFFAYPELHIDPTDTFLIATGPHGWFNLYCSIDIIAENPALIIPSRLFVPHEGSRRMEAFLQRTDMLPIFFSRTGGGVGVRIDSNVDFDMLLDVPTRITAHSLKVILHLLNYTPNEKQIQLRTAAGSPNVSSRRLARLVAAKVSHFVREAERENPTITQWADPRWRMGSGPGYIGSGDIVLLGIVFVSQGKITPLLRVRGDFVFLF